MLQFIKIVSVSTLVLLLVAVVALQAMDAPQRLESKVIPNESLPY